MDAPRGIARARYRRGAAYADQGLHAQALEAAQASLALFRQIDDAWGPGGAHQVIGRALSGLGRPDRAAEAYRRALAVFTSVSDTRRAHQTAHALRLAEDTASASAHDGGGPFLFL
ncbi:tetratricopeptide repeat protein [Streptomyces sp. NPDC004284]|uniref:tetratricopeptide repeat protein n=1 Tax=Streptomyces sp. NPDC004284 TaxID=3364695 RepID=UPI00369A4F13